MSEDITHECGIALIRLLKPIEYFEQKYGTPLYAFHKLFILMEKQHNRGYDGAGIGAVKLNMAPGKPYLFRERSIDPNALMSLFFKNLERYHQKVAQGIIIPELPYTVKEHFEFGAEILLGHLRYSTSGSYGTACCHPYFRRSNWPTKNLMLAGNFNMTNDIALNQQLIQRGQHPIFDTDTQTILEGIGYHLDEAHNQIYREMRDKKVPGNQIPYIISENLDPVKILREAARDWDGGYAIAGLIGNGDCFVLRDPSGIRPCSYLKTEEYIAVTSERVPLLTIFNQKIDAIEEVPPGHAIVIKNNGHFYNEPYTQPLRKQSCVFERIYFSRGNDAAIYAERKRLGAALADQVVHAIGSDFNHMVFSFIPNTAEIAYYGLMGRLREIRRLQVKAALQKARASGELTDELIDKLILANWPRSEKIAHKDIKLRTFISQEKEREILASHVYDITYGVVKPSDTLVVIDDSIVRGTTLRQSILKILSRIEPKRIFILSTAPQIRYPDCYGIDMSEMGKFIAFQAAIALLKEKGDRECIREVYEACTNEVAKPMEEQVNQVKRIYQEVTTEQISKKIAQFVYPQDTGWKGELNILFQTIEDLHHATPDHTGDWYFTGHYPTPGGVASVNQAFIHYYENRHCRSYGQY